MTLRTANLGIHREAHSLGGESWYLGPNAASFGKCAFQPPSLIHHGKPREEVRKLGSFAVTLPSKAYRKTLAWRKEK